MFSFLNILLVSRLLVMSDRDHFCEAEKISKKTEIAWDDQQKMDVQELKDKKILLVIHGFNNSLQEAMQSYHTVANHITSLTDAEGLPLYDIVVGYLWPGYDNKLEYYSAKEHARKLKDKMKEHLRFLTTTAAKVDVMAHSMGNRLVFEALNFSPKKNAKKLVQKFYSLAAAVDNESIEKNQKYFHASKNCEEIFIFHSKQDEILQFLYSMAEWDKALGFEGVENLKKLPKNVQLIDCTNFITGHSQYFYSDNIYGFIRNELLKQGPSTQKVPNLRILANGDIETISSEKK